MISSTEYQNMVKAQKRLSVIEDDWIRRYRAAMAIDFYNYAQREYMLYIISKIYPETWKDIDGYINCVDITKQIINDKSILFQIPPTITIEGSDTVQEQATAVIDASELWKKLIVADRMAELTGKVGVGVHYHPEDNRVVIDVITPEKCYVIADPLDPTKAKEVFYVIDEMNPTISNGYTNRVDVYAHWTKDTFQKVILKKDMTIDKIIPGTQIPNPYNRIPIIWLSPEIEVDTFWNDGDSALILGNVNINLRESNLDVALDYQSFSTMVTKGLPSAKDTISGITRRIDILAEAGMDLTGVGVDYITPDAKLTEVSEIINTKKINLAKQSGLSAEAFNRESGKVNSGYELELTKMDIINDNELKGQIYRQDIRQLIQNILDCYSFNSSTTAFPQDANITISYGKPKFKNNRLDDLNYAMNRYRDGVYSLTDVMMDLNPDLSRADAEVELERIAQEKAKLNPNQVRAITEEDLA
jgi:hypothetical protein